MKKSQLRNIIRSVIREQMGSELSKGEEPIIKQITPVTPEPPSLPINKQVTPEPPSLPINKQVRPKPPKGKEPINKDFEKDITKINPQEQLPPCSNPNARAISAQNCATLTGYTHSCFLASGGVPQVGQVVKLGAANLPSSYFEIGSVSPSYPGQWGQINRPVVSTGVGCGFNCVNNNCEINLSGQPQYPTLADCNQYCNNPSVRYACGETCVGCSTLGTVHHSQWGPQYYPTWPDNGNGTCCKELLPGDPGYATASTTGCTGCPDLNHYQCHAPVNYHPSQGNIPGTCEKWDPCARTYSVPNAGGGGSTTVSMGNYLGNLEVYNMLVHVENWQGITYGVNGQPQTLSGCQACCNIAGDWCRA